jgi:hypothetical protein
MTLFDLRFLASTLFILICLVLILISALRRRSDRLRWWARVLLSYGALYALVLLATSLLSPRRVLAPGQRRCWDDWCATAERAVPAGASTISACPSAPNTRLWLAEIQVYSDAKRVRQRAPDAHAQLEDQNGVRYSPCAGWLTQGTNPPHALSDPLGPGESFSVLLPFQIPANQQPAGLVLEHGKFPGVVIIGDDCSFLHTQTLQPFATLQKD